MEQMTLSKAGPIVRQVAIGLIPSIIVLLGALWLFSADFSQVKAVQKQHEKDISEFKEKIKLLDSINTTVSNIEVTLEFIRENQQEIKDQLKRK